MNRVEDKTMSMGRTFKTLLRENKYLVTPGVTTPLHARIVEKAGFKFVYVGGHDVSITLLGLADAGFLTQTEMTTNARHIAGSVDIPVMVDADTGYGNAINAEVARRFVESWQRTRSIAGMAGYRGQKSIEPCT